MAKTKPKKTDPNVTASRAYASEKYGPAIAQVVAAQGQAHDDFQSDIESAKNAAASGKAFALNAIPNVQKTYSDAMSQADSDNSFINSELAKLGGAADVFKGANVKAQGASHDRITAAGADAEQGLRDRATAAEAGKQFATNKARADYRKTVGGLRQQLIDLGTQAGDAAANKLSELLQANLDRQNKLDVANVGADATTGAAKIRADAQAQRDKNKQNKPALSGKDKIKNRSDFNRAKGWAASLKGGGQYPDPSGALDAKGNPKKISIPAAKSWQELYQSLVETYPTVDGTMAKAAAQLAFKKLGPETQRLLKQLGVKASRPPRPRSTPLTSSDLPHGAAGQQVTG